MLYCTKRSTLSLQCNCNCTLLIKYKLYYISIIQVYTQFLYNTCMNIIFHTGSYMYCKRIETKSQMTKLMNDKK